MSAKLIPDTASRCDNEACKEKMNCKRFLQLEMDFNSNKPDLVCVETFNDYACLNKLEFKKS